MEENEKDLVVSLPPNEENDQVVVAEEIGETEKVTIDSLEAHKAAFLKTYRNSRIISYASSIIVIAIVVCAYIFLFDLGEVGMTAGIITIIVTLIASTVFSQWHRRKISAKVRQYMADYNGEANRIAFEDSEVRNYVFDFTGQITKEPFVEARFLVNIINTDSRNLVMYDVGDWHVEYADYVAYRPDEKRAKSVFYGKFLNATRSETIDGRIVIYIKPDQAIFENAAGPDDIADLELLTDEAHYQLYATSKSLKKKISSEALETLLSIKPTKDLADVTVIFHSNKIAATFTYSDAVLIVPYKEAVNTSAVLEHKANVTAFNKFLTLL